MSRPLNKTCIRCGLPKKPYSVKITPRHPAGIAFRCRNCESSCQKSKYKSNPEKFRKRSREWRAAHVDTARERFKQWASSNKCHRSAWRKKWTAKNSAHIRAYRRLWDNKHPERAAFTRAKGKLALRSKIPARFIPDILVALIVANSRLRKLIRSHKKKETRAN